MKKILLSLAVGAMVISAAPAFAATSVKGTVNLTCMQTATKKRDTAMIAAWNTYSSAVSAALTNRMNASNAAWVITDKASRNAAFKTLKNNYSTAIRTARTNFKNSKSTAWTTYSIEAKKCGNISVTTTEDLTISIDTTL